ncbi:Uncharacterised protein [Mycobacteroides abscessus subsp. abscessus]|nr:Uncharacterised protein [Mycobacteroides abscessus subsp. abscessus]
MVTDIPGQIAYTVHQPANIFDQAANLSPLMFLSLGDQIDAVQYVCEVVAQVGLVGVLHLPPDGFDFGGHFPNVLAVASAG